MATMYTVSQAALLKEAFDIESYATDSLRAWILTGQTERYSEEMKKARAIRSAAEYKSPAVRREILRNIGYEIAKI